VTLIAALRQHGTNLLLEEADRVSTGFLGGSEQAEGDYEYDHATTLPCVLEILFGLRKEIHQASRLKKNARMRIVASRKWVPEGKERCVGKNGGGGDNRIFLIGY